MTVLFKLRYAFTSTQPDGRYKMIQRDSSHKSYLSEHMVDHRSQPQLYNLGMQLSGFFLSFLAGGSKPVKRLDLFPVLLPQKISQFNNYKKVYNQQHERQ